MGARSQQPLDLTGYVVPTHIAIIMDGNGRWARQRGFPRQAGHRQGAENLRRVINACVEFGVQILTIYAFSTENWARPEKEVRGLMRIMARVLDQEIDDLCAQGVCLHHLGDLTGIDPKLQDKVRRAIEMTKDNHTLILNVAFNYGRPRRNTPCHQTNVSRRNLA
jgi:undecaprenyl diphosphate synthase